MDDLTYLRTEIAEHLRLRDNRKCGIDPKRLGRALARVIARSNNDPEMLAAIRCSIDGRDEDDDGNWNDSAAIEEW